MSGFKNFLIIALIAALFGESWYLTRKISEDGKQIAALTRTDAEARERVRQMKIQFDQTRKPSPTPAVPESAPADAMELRMAGILDRIHLLKAWADRNPEQRTGELAYLDDNVWIRTCGQFQKLESEEDYRKAFASLREWAQSDFLTGPLSKALRAYFKTSGDMLPADINQLAEYLDSSVDPSLLQHYEMIATGSAKDTRQMPVFAANPQTATVDPTFDRTAVGGGPGGSWSRGVNQNQSVEYVVDQMQAQNAYRLANAGQQPVTPEQIIPYFKNPQFGAQYLTQLQKGR